MKSRTPRLIAMCVGTSALCAGLGLGWLPAAGIITICWALLDALEAVANREIRTMLDVQALVREVRRAERVASLK